MQLAELVSAGNLGLVEAATRFHGGKQASFTTFAGYRIRGAILDALRDADTLSRHYNDLSKELLQAEADLAARLGHAPDQEQVGRELGITTEELHARRLKVVRASQVPVEHIDRLPAHGASPEASILNREFLEQLSGYLALLPQRVRQVVALRYWGDMTFKEIGLIMGVTESRICQINGEAIRTMRSLAKGN